MKLSLNHNIKHYLRITSPLPNMIPSFGIRISSEFENINLDLDDNADFKISNLSPWTFSQPRVLFPLHNDKKSQTNPLVFRTKFHELLSDFPNYETIFTAGSVCVTSSDTYKCRLPDNASIFSAKTKAIDLALDHIEHPELVPGKNRPDVSLCVT